MRVDKIDERIWEAVAEATGVGVEDIIGRSRKRGVCIARQIFAATLRSRGFTLMAIGSTIGRDFSTVINLCRRHEADYRYDAEYRRMADEVYNKLNTERI